ncbi:MAG: PadR family transcriptional regulator [Cellulosilyticum sp.]|nr:PadR family transcriptional regulator [Cellulosilyticum sp.]
MFSKASILLLGMISEGDKGAYEITKMLEQMRIRWWFNIGDSTVYAAIKNLNKKGYILGRLDKQGNMPERTIYTITAEGMVALKEAIIRIVGEMDFDTTIVSIAVNYLDIFTQEERKNLLDQRITILAQYIQGIEAQLHNMHENETKSLAIVNLERMKEIVEIEYRSTKQILMSMGK